ncbi:MAG TPA: hypothetical protein VMZ91_09755 [Candidatus Paceibacterota bacterium]|nr:hypothetical protein [Candidatus Paceibacterota bacterium]
MNNKKLQKLIEKYYWSHGQHLILDTWEEMQGNKNDTSFDVQLADTDIGLFTVQNYSFFTDWNIYFKNHFKENHIVKKWDGVKASYVPFYINQTFTLKKFEPITKEDILNCTRYFLSEIFGMWQIFNIKFKEEKK